MTTVSASPRISVVICTRNRAALLEKCLLSLEKQTLSAQSFEVLVVDNASDDDTQHVVQRFSERLPCSSVIEPVVGLSRARNRGWQTVRSNFIAFLDDDALADPGWLAAALSSFESIRPVPAAMTGPIDLIWEKKPPEWLTPEIQGCLGLLNFGPEARTFGGIETLFGANCFFHRSILERFGGFNERLGRLNTVLLSGEETLLQRQIENAGECLWYNPEASVRHWVAASRINRGWFFRRYYWGGVSDYYMQKILGPVKGSPDALRERGRMQRVIKNITFSLGVGSQKQVVHARIYLCYVLGWFSGILKWYRAGRAELADGIYEQ